MPIKMETISQQTLYRELDEILNRVSGKRIPTLVIKDNRPTVVIFPYETYQQWIAAREQRLHQACRSLQAWVSEHSEVLTGLDSVQLVRETRNSQ
jgi:PHD/YefM family antitoxin component YafN of YafNO toxin-antitoxin module